MQQLWKAASTKHIVMFFELEIRRNIKHRAWPIKCSKYKNNKKDISNNIYMYFGF